MANGSSKTGENDPNVITLGVLSAIEEDDRATQRAISQELGIALGLANAYLKRCVKKGFVKVQHIPANRYAYYLTPQGFAEKSRLTADYLSMSFNFFRSSREQCAALFQSCEERRWTRVALAGCGDLAEIFTLCRREGSDVEIVGIIDTSADGDAPERFAGLPVVRRLTDLKSPCGCRHRYSECTTGLRWAQQGDPAGAGSDRADAQGVAQAAGADT